MAVADDSVENYITLIVSVKYHQHFLISKGTMGQTSIYMARALSLLNIIEICIHVSSKEFDSNFLIVI